MLHKVVNMNHELTTKEQTAKQFGNKQGDTSVENLVHR